MRCPCLVTDQALTIWGRGRTVRPGAVGGWVQVSSGAGIRNGYLSLVTGARDL
jgi:hypothetical protein